MIRFVVLIVVVGSSFVVLFICFCLAFIVFIVVWCVLLFLLHVLFVIVFVCVVVLQLFRRNRFHGFGFRFFIFLRVFRCRVSRCSGVTVIFVYVFVFGVFVLSSGSVSFLFARSQFWVSFALYSSLLF